MTILEFINHFSEEKDCKSYYRQIREQEGIIHKRCEGQKHYWLKNREVFECSHCKLRTSINKGNVLFTDKSTSYLNLAKYVDLHTSEKSTKDSINGILKWVHIAISNR